MERKELAKLEVELGKYANMQNDELGEFCTMLTLLCGRTGCAITETFSVALEAEIVAQIQNVRDYATIITETITPEPYTVEKLEWNNGQD